MMNIKSSFLFASRLIFPRNSLNSSARRSVIGAILCVAICIVPLVVVLSVSNGMIGGMTKRLISLDSGDIKCYLRKTAVAAESASEMKRLAKRISEVEGVRSVYTQVECDGLAASKSYRTGAAIRAVETSIFSEQDFASLFQTVSGDTSLFATGKRNAVIGQKLSELLKVSAGDTIRLITTKINESGNISPQVSVFKVCAVVSSGYQEMDALWVFVPFETGFGIVPRQSASYSIIANTNETFSKRLEMIVAGINSEIAGNGIAYGWKDVNQYKFENFASTKVLLLFVMILIVIVSTVNISSAIIMLVMERKTEIAILKSVGGSPSEIALSFTIAGVFCGVAGTLIGFPVGLILSVNANALVVMIEKIVNFVAKAFFLLQGGSAEAFSHVNLLDPSCYLTTIPVNIPVPELTLIFILVILLSFGASVMPAIKAGKEKPLEIFRKA